MTCFFMYNWFYSVFEVLYFLCYYIVYILEVSMNNIDESVLAEEKEYLKKVEEILNDLIEASGERVAKQQRENQALKKMIWDTRTEHTDSEYNSQLSEINHNTNMLSENVKQALNYQKAVYSPYFGRIDFKRDGSNRSMHIYVGLTTVKENMDFYVFDWRTPVASLFYNYSIGEAQYEAPKRTIKGKIDLRRQYKIENGELKRLIESDINIDDEFLQEILSNSSSDRMKNIVTTIQKEQNEIIRNKSTNNLIVQGVAGSGKTSVALHRIAYLLYQRKDLNSDNILIFSPNNIFAEYISDVLPELGEDNVLNTTFSDLASAYIKNKKIQSFSNFIEEYYDNEKDEFKNEIISFKLSDEYKKVLDLYMLYYTKSHCLKESFEFVVGNSREVFIDKDEINDLFVNKFGHLPIIERINRIVDYVCSKDNIPFSKYNSTVRSQLRKAMGIDLDVKRVYNDFMNSEIYTNNFDFDVTSFYNKNKPVPYEDIMGMLYLNFELNDYPYNTNVKHIVIDEAQDYSKLQLDIIKKIFPHATFTILGDVNQTINPFYKYDTLESLKDIFGNSTEYYELLKSYRSSPEITDYANNILGLGEDLAVRNSTNKPVINEEENPSMFEEQIYEDIERMRNDGLKRIAIITRNKKEVDELFSRLKSGNNDISFSTSSMQNDNVIIVPAYIAKGLEFDGVIAYTKPDDYYTEDEKNLYYVVCTRAQHQLVVYNQPQYVLEKPKMLVRKK